MMSTKKVLLKAVTTLFKKPLWNEFEVCAVKLSLSSIFNKINPVIVEILYEQSSNQEEPTSTSLELKDISEISHGLVEEVMAIKDVDEMLSFIYEKKVNGQAKEAVIGGAHNAQYFVKSRGEL